MRMLLVVGAALAVTASGCGCSIDSTVNPPKGMRCIQAHDEFHDSGGPVTVCDTYAPTPEATP